MGLWSSWGLVLVAQDATTSGVLINLSHLGDEFLPFALVGRCLDIGLVAVAGGGLVVLFVGFIASILGDL